jgi:hypothetical protein
VQREFRLSIITINYNGLKDTCALLKSIPRTEGIEIIVVDNASATDEASAIESAFPDVCVVRSRQNLGFAGGNNLGYRHSHGRYLYFINNDTEFKDDANIDFLIARLESSDNIGVVCPKIRFFWEDNPIQFAGYTPLSTVTLRNRAIGFGEKDHGQYDVPHPTPYAHGAAMLCKREAIEKAGVMPECYFLYYEELDWSMMFRRTGYELWYDPSATIYHKESQTTGQGSPLRTYYITRNRLLFARRNISMPKRYLTFIYLIFLVAVRDTARSMFGRRANLAKATLRGIVGFFKGDQGRSTTYT